LSKTKIKALAIFFALLTIISIIFLTYATQLPTEENQTITLCNYTQDGTYNYTAKLEQPNIIYNNKPTLAEGEGPIYLQITQELYLTFTYTFESTLTANTTIKYSASAYIVTARWTKQNFTIPQKTITNNSDTTTFHFDTPTIDVVAIGKLVGDINSEIGVSTGNYNMTIATTILLTAETQEGTIDESLTSTLNIAFQRGTPEGDIITLENLEATKTGEITQTQTIQQDSNRNMQYASYATSIASTAGLAVFSILYLRTKPPAPPQTTEKLVQDLIEPYEDIIVEAAREPSTQGQTTIQMKTLEDLVRIADTLSKPIVHLQKPPTPENQEPTDMFYVLDDITRYEYKVTPSMIKTAQERAPEESEED